MVFVVSWMGEVSFDSCIVMMSGCVVCMRCLSSSTVLLMPFCVELKYFLFLCVLFWEVFCLFRVWVDVRRW